MRTFGPCSFILFIGTIKLCAGIEGPGLPNGPCSPNSGSSSYFKSHCCDDEGHGKSVSFFSFFRKLTKTPGHSVKINCFRIPPKSVKHMA
ncbi:hypothetical protein PGTUg99_015948 [Puccinia graminis f. sp. tritici]|uniref:Secreted protein n=1 Tax=Puccinia graminis f. sp. tritici TaxID=56615 RepID=A0A5B0S027_PUCGR|nr:hypothetical protein PGTUg99_015948 [Puccinia graminis f. sp. tritici]